VRVPWILDAQTPVPPTVICRSTSSGATDFYFVMNRIVTDATRAVWGVHINVLEAAYSSVVDVMNPHTVRQSRKQWHVHNHRVTRRW
jgi:hypothetical protein